MLGMTLITFIELCAVIASGMFGALQARRKGMDFVGVYTIACIAAFGGGTMRDLFLDRQPLFWIEHDHYPMVVFGIALGVSLARGRWLSSEKGGVLERFLHFPDALGLGLFSMVGVQYALDAETSLFIASLLGVTTGIFGGLIGDVVCNEAPSVFVSTPLYATCSFAGCWSYIAIVQVGFEGAEPYALATGIVVTVALRMLALRYNWRLPTPDPGGKSSG
jgi:uncharacterized membrane protein YeiH